MDRDTAEVSALLRRAARSSGMTNGEFATAVGTSGSRFSTYVTGATRPSAQFLVRAQRIGTSLAAARLLGLPSAPLTARRIRLDLQAAGVEAWRHLLDGLASLAAVTTSRDPVLLASWEAVPAPTGSQEWDVLLAATAAHYFEAAGHPAPDWTRTAALREPWRPAPLGTAAVEGAGPLVRWLLPFNILVPEGVLTPRQVLVT